MYLKRIEVQGFKSFPEKIRLDFNMGITGVVGPNGSGKSNISDAIRWVLGEQSAKTLRGDKMEDIIFAGTKNRKPLGFCEVCITLDNSDKKLNIDYTEITVARRVYRSGESGYFINGSSCRLKDITELFMDTGIGKEGYSIIGQGKIDSILSNKSEDRRAVFEEAVGIVKFKNRKVQTENKLEEVRKNLIRTTDIIEEIEKQIQPLKIQSEKAKKFISLSKNLKDIHINLFVEKYNKAKEDIFQIDKNINEIHEDIKTVEDKRQNDTKNQENLKKELIKKEEKIEIFNKNFSEISLNIEKYQSDIKLKEQNINFIDESVARLQKEKEKNKNEIDKKNNEINFINTSILAKNMEYSSKKNSLNNFLKEFNNFSSNITEKEEKIENINSNIIEKMNKSSEISNMLASFRSAKKQLESRNMQLLDEINMSKSKKTERETRKLVLMKELENLGKSEDENKEKLKNLEKISKKLLQTISDEKKEYDNDNKKYFELKNKYKILNDLEKNYEGYFNSVKAVLKEKAINTAFSGVCGAVGELISVPKKYETAVEIALGGAVQHIIVKTDNDAKISINFLKNTKKGRATFLPISSIKPKTLGSEKAHILNEKGVLCIADETLSFKEEYKNIMSSLLGRVVIMDNIDNAMIVSKKYNFRYKIVTISGEIINTGGALTGGSILKKGVNIFSRSGEIKIIYDEIINYEKKIFDIKNKINKNEKENNEYLENIEKYTNIIHKDSIKKATIIGEIAQANEYLENINANLDAFFVEKEKLKKSVNIDEEKRLEDEIASINCEINNLKNSLLSYKNNIEKNSEDKNLILENINELKLDIQAIEHNTATYEKEIIRINEEIKNIEKNNIGENIFENIAKKNNLKNEINNIKNNINKCENEHNILKNEYEKLQIEKAEIVKNIDYVSEQILKSTTSIADLQNAQTRLLAKKENTENKIESLADAMWEDYEITYASASNEYIMQNVSYDDLMLQENTLKKEISALGNVNVSAVEEYKIIKERYELNVAQKDDILKADGDLKNIIVNLEKEMEKQFREQFELINKNFKEVFSEIFSGGTANLKLYDEDDILKSGIEIVAQPPGKNLQSLTLLSGGERTLTAMSLLFAILRMKPSPFCVLDETEAALDDANVVRYANFLKKFAKKTQFILITHKTGTMEIANVLYGVTMQEQGVSKIISVELKEAKEYQNV